MQINVRKRKITERAARIILCATLYAALVLFIGSLFILSANYQRIYKSPTVNGAKADFAGVDILSRGVPCTLTGEWEFYYNQWIITDGFGQSDGMIKLPGLWTNRDFGNGALPRTGYASYRLTVENVQPDIEITVFRHNADVAYRVFLNGKLNVRSGNISKDPAQTVVSGRYDEKIPYRTDGSPIEIVIELSATNGGGFNTSPWLNYDWSGDTYGARLRSFTYVALGISAAAVIISILTYLFFGFKRDITVPAFMSALFIHFFCSKDMMYLFSFAFTATRTIAFFSAVASFVIFVIHLKRCGVKFNVNALIMAGGAAAVSAILLFAMYGTPYAPFAALLLVLTGCAFLVPITGSSLPMTQRVVYAIFFSVLMSVFCAELCDGLGLLVFGTEFYFSIELMLILACFTVLWLWKMAAAAHTAMRVSELECELSSVKQRALKAQIKPHFVYNSLTAIQARYRSGLKDGDRAIEQFARHLRLITDSDGEEMIDFESEVRNVMNYFELENLRADGKMNLLLDLSFTDFKVPVLSLQPLVENAIRHGGLRQTNDGLIELSSKISDGKIIITVADNGNGFDTESVPEGVGLENTRKRFELIGATMQIISSIGHGTRAVIEIPSE